MGASSKPSRNLALELVRVTEAAALMAAHFMGRDDKEAADQAAVDAMRYLLNSVEMEATVIIGEGEKDEAPMLFNGEVLGKGGGLQLDLAVDPIDGTRPLAQGRPNSIATVAAAPAGTMYDPGPFVYMDKIAVGPGAKGAINIEWPVEANLNAIARALGKRMRDLTVIILDRPRHADLVARIRKAGPRIRFIDDGDVAAALMTSWPDSGIDVLLGVGGTPEGVIAACALSAMGGEIQGKLFARNEGEKQKGIEMGYDFDKVITMDDLVSSDDVFFAATGITDGELMDGVRYHSNGATTESIVVRGETGTVRFIESRHSFEKLETISDLPY
ncbi:MAG: class II fructose-bisphosphatase [Anaerolineales bacterium]|nr:class II fructose-bisphosphatase [Anaerolineales bacterium]